MRTLIGSCAVFNGEILMDGARDVLFDESGIIAVEPAGSIDPSQADVRVDGSGRTLLPGLIDAHVHISEPAQLDRLLSHGVTTALDMAVWPLDFQRELRRLDHGSDFRSVGAPLASHHGTHARIPNFSEESLTDDAARAREIVRERVEEGSDFIKIILEAPGQGGLADDVVRAAIEEAHAAGLIVVAHAASAGAYEVGVGGGVDVLTHAPLDRDLTPNLLTDLVQRGIVSVPTLTMMRGTADHYAEQGLRYEVARRAVADLREAGVRIVVGTDANQAPGVPAQVDHGTSLHEELELLVEVGLSPLEALQGATRLSAATFGLTDRGVVEPGMRADLLLISGDPTRDISATRRRDGIWQAGARVDDAARA